MYLSPAILSVCASLLLGGTVSLVVWLVKQVNRHAVMMAEIVTEQKAHGRDILALQTWRAVQETARSLAVRIAAEATVEAEKASEEGGHGGDA